MNLYAKCGKEDMHLFQTPTYITEMCLMDTNGLKWEMKGAKAKRALRAYCTWYAQKYNDGVYASKEEADEARATVMEHTDYIRECIDSGKSLRVYQL